MYREALYYMHRDRYSGVVEGVRVGYTDEAIAEFESKRKEERRLMKKFVENAAIQAALSRRFRVIYIGLEDAAANEYDRSFAWNWADPIPNNSFFSIRAGHLMAKINVFRGSSQWEETDELTVPEDALITYLRSGVPIWEDGWSRDIRGAPGEVAENASDVKAQWVHLEDVVHVRYLVAWNGIAYTRQYQITSLLEHLPFRGRSAS